MLSQGATIAVISKKIGVSDYTYYRWRKEYSGMRVYVVSDSWLMRRRPNKKVQR